MNTTPYADPYRDVSLDVTYRSPSGRRMQFWGLHDGSNLWKLRFMPDEVGRWNYEARLDDRSGEAAGAFECVHSDPQGTLCGFQGTVRRRIRAEGRALQAGARTGHCRLDRVVCWPPL